MCYNLYIFIRFIKIHTILLYYYTIYDYRSCIRIFSDGELQTCSQGKGEFHLGGQPPDTSLQNFRHTAVAVSISNLYLSTPGSYPEALTIGVGCRFQLEILLQWASSAFPGLLFGEKAYQPTDPEKHHSFFGHSFIHLIVAIHSST